MSRPSRRAHRIRAGSAVLLAAALLAACGSPGTSDSTSGEPVDGGELTVYSRTITTLDPRQTHGVISRALADSLLDLDPETQEYVPWLASDWSVNDELTEFTFVLRDDVTFSDGSELTPEVVQINFDAAQQQVEDGFGWYIRGIFDYYEGTEVVDDNTVTVHFSEPNPSFLPTVPTSFLAILSADSWDNEYEERQAGEFIGSGPYVIASYTPNESVVLERRDDYVWASGLSENSGPASIETITFSFVDEQSVRENALLAGEIQLAQNPTIEGASTLESQGFELISRAQVGNPYSFVFNFERPLARDIDVRRALRSRSIARRSRAASPVTGSRRRPASSRRRPTATPTSRTSSGTTRTRRARSSRRPVGSRVPTASGRRTASGCRSRSSTGGSPRRSSTP